MFYTKFEGAIKDHFKETGKEKCEAFGIEFVDGDKRPREKHQMAVTEEDQKERKAINSKIYRYNPMLRAIEKWDTETEDITLYDIYDVD